jgi:hypothetical protein
MLALSVVSVVQPNPVVTVIAFIACVVAWVWVASVFTNERIVLPVRFSGALLIGVAILFKPMLQAYVCGGTEDWWLWYGAGCWLLYW